MIEKPTLAGVAFVATNMRAADAEEIWPLRFDKTPEGLARTVMSDPAYVWLATAGEPVAAFGMFEDKFGLFWMVIVPTPMPA